MRPDQESQVHQMHAAGSSNREIAKAVGFSHVTVAKVLSGNLAPVVTPSGNPSRAAYGADGEPLWPSYEPTGEVRIGLSGYAYPVLRPLPPRPANRRRV